MNDRPTAHKMLTIEQLERNILTDLREILLAADADIPDSHVDTNTQRFLTLCNQLGAVKLLGMSYPLLAVLNFVELLKYWHIKYDAATTTTVRRLRAPKQGTDTPPPSFATCIIKDISMFLFSFWTR